MSLAAHRGLVSLARLFNPKREKSVWKLWPEFCDGHIILKHKYDHHQSSIFEGLGLRVQLIKIA